MVGELLHDLRFAVRVLARRPGFTIVAVATLALGIGANTAVFSVVNSILVRPLPFAHSNELVSVWPNRFLSYRELEAFRERARSMQDFGGVVLSWNAALTGEGDPAQLIGSRTTVNLFRLLGVPAALGRTFAPQDGALGAEPVVVLSHDVWRARFGTDPAAIGRRIMLDGVAHTVIGVMPPGFELGQNNTEIWQPLIEDPEEWYYRGGGMLAIARLAAGASVHGANDEFRTLVADLREEFALPDDYGRDASIVSLKDRLVGDVRATLLLLLGAAGLILLIACANLGNLLLTRASGRARELAVRAALGATRGRLVLQLLTESAVLAIAGGIAGLALAAVTVRVITSLLPADTPRIAGIGIDFTVLAASALFAIASGLAFGIAPALIGTRTNLQRALRGLPGIASIGGQRLRGAFVIAEVALALMLVVGTGLMLRTLWNLNRVNLGFEPRSVLSMKVQPTGERVRTWEQRRLFYREVFDRIEALPGVISVGAIQHLPLSGGGWGSSVESDGQAPAAGEALPVVGWRVVGEKYFRSMSIPLLAGRPFEPSDGPEAQPVIVVNRALADRFWPGEDPIGRRLRAEQATGGEWATVVGMVGNVRHARLEDEAIPEMYRPLEQYTHGGMTLTVRTESNPALVTRVVQEAIWSVDPDVPISGVRTVEQVVSASAARPRLILTLLGAFAAVGLFLGALGIYGVIAYTVRQKRREIGIRIALGALPAAVIGSVVAGGLRYAFIGVVIGAAGALSLARVMQGLVFGISVNDPLTLLATAAFVLATAAVASFVPARQAARLDPSVVLREER